MVVRKLSRVILAGIIALALPVLQSCSAQTSPSTVMKDVKPALPDPPAGFRAERDKIVHGNIAEVQYDSKTLGTRRPMIVYTPPNYSTDKKYPVLYLLHGLNSAAGQWP